MINQGMDQINLQISSNPVSIALHSTALNRKEDNNILNDGLAILPRKRDLFVMYFSQQLEQYCA